MLVSKKKILISSSRQKLLAKDVYHNKLIRWLLTNQKIKTVPGIRRRFCWTFNFFITSGIDAQKYRKQSLDIHFYLFSMSVMNEINDSVAAICYFDVFEHTTSGTGVSRPSRLRVLFNGWKCILPFCIALSRFRLYWEKSKYERWGLSSMHLARL